MHRAITLVRGKANSLAFKPCINKKTERKIVDRSPPSICAEHSEITASGPEWHRLRCRCQKPVIRPNMDFIFDWEGDVDRFSFEDSDRFEEDSLCSWISEPESLCNNWRGWRNCKQQSGIAQLNTTTNYSGEPPFSLCIWGVTCWR